jgi:hypothetical protein
MATNTALTISLDDIQGNVIGTAGNPAYVEIALCNYGPFLPRVIGTGMIAKVGPYLIPFVGTPIVVNLFSNDQITPLGTYYSITILDEKKNPLQSGAYTFLGTVSTSLSSLAQTFPSYGPSVLGGLVSVPFSATPEFNAALVRGPMAFSMTLTGNVTAPTLIGVYPGQIITFIIKQDGTGGRTFAWPASVISPGSIGAGALAVTVQAFIADQNGNLYPISSSGAGSTSLRATVNITAAQLKTAHAAPVTIIAAPGAGKFIRVTYVQIKYTFGTVAYTSGSNFGLDYGATLAGTILTASSPTISGALVSKAVLGIGAIGSVIQIAESFIDNQAVNFGVLATEFATGDGTLSVVVDYTIETF